MNARADLRDPPSGSNRPLRVAICSTPRSGNTWLRRLLDCVYTLPQFVVDTPDEIDWQRVDQFDRCLLQLHWGPEPPLVQRLGEYGFRVVTLTRHPLDLLLSILHFASTWPSTAMWFGGRGGDESAIVGATPRSPQFLDYATGRRAASLLSISRAWAAADVCLVARYETLVDDTPDQLSRLVAQLEPATSKAVEAAIEDNSLEKLRASALNQHFWEGVPGNWRRLVPRREAEQIATAHKELFDEFRYDCDADPDLDERQADANWFAMELATMREEFRQARTQLRQSRDLLFGVGARIDQTDSKIAAHAEQLQANLDQSNEQIEELQVQLEELHRQASPLLAVGPTALTLARQLTRLSIRYPRVSAAARRLVRPLTERRRAA